MKIDQNMMKMGKKLAFKFMKDPEFLHKFNALLVSKGSKSKELANFVKEYAEENEE